MRGAEGRVMFTLQERDSFIEQPHVVALVKSHVVVPLRGGPACMYVCICLYVYMYIYIYIYIHLYTRIYG